MDIAADVACVRLIPNWVRRFGLNSHSGWVEDWVTSRFQESKPDLCRWLALLGDIPPRELEMQEKKVQEFRRQFPGPSSGSLDAEFMSTRKVPPSERELRTLLSASRKEGRRNIERSLLQQPALEPTIPANPTKKAGHYKTKHFTWLTLRICGVSSGLIARKDEDGATASAVNEGSKTCAKLVDICWPIVRQK
ncbi:MAG: hypothetical protein M3O20_05530 [Acidobacteriota bacterium]|nr:hypothetical protein [Acidobacteriota bacterium]